MRWRSHIALIITKVVFKDEEEEEGVVELTLSGSTLVTR